MPQHGTAEYQQRIRMEQQKVEGRLVKMRRLRAFAIKQDMPRSFIRKLDALLAAEAAPLQDERERLALMLEESERGYMAGRKQWVSRAKPDGATMIVASGG